ncbi:MAG: class I SAM-dependent methyltransferase [Pirellulaceae bacterium]
MISGPTVNKGEIRSHYDLATLFYRLLWGEHIHHGLWEADESPQLAQRQLVEHLMQVADIPRGADVVDVGCGMGGSSRHLARHLDCQVTGLTLSGVQRRWAGFSAWRQGLGKKTHFLKQDAESADFPENSFDFLWSVECTEHLFDKPAFFQRAAKWLRPGGGMALCVWLAGDEPHSEQDVARVEKVCDAFLCPSLGTTDDYVRWMTEAGLDVHTVTDLTDKVTRTWEICQRRIQRSGVQLAARVFGRRMIEFVDNFEAILDAYRSGSMRYASFAARVN